MLYNNVRIYKLTLVSHLNANPFLSKDTLIRVKNSIFFNNSKVYLVAVSSMSAMLLGLGCDCGIYFVQRSTVVLLSTIKAIAKRAKGRCPKRDTTTNV